MNKAPSNEGSNSGIADVKYQKAIKEISKLISLNTTLKKQITTLQQNYDKCKADYEALEQKYSNLEFEMSSIQSSINFDSRQSLNGQDKISASREEAAISELLEHKKNHQYLHQKIAQKDQKIQSLKKQLEVKAQQNNQWYTKYLNLNEQVAKIKSNKNLKNIQSVQKQKKQLKKELQKSEQMVQRITNQYQSLKKQVILNEKNNLKFAKNMQESISSMGHLRDPLSDFYFEKLKKSEAENIRLKQRVNLLKNKAKAQINKLKQYNSNLVCKLIDVSKLLQKQNKFIQVYGLSKKNPDGSTV